MKVSATYMDMPWESFLDNMCFLFVLCLQMNILQYESFTKKMFAREIFENNEPWLNHCKFYFAIFWIN